MRLLLKTHILIAGICVLALPAFAARKDKPSGPEIAQKARTAVLDLASREERFFSTSAAYTNSAANLGYAAFPAPVGSNYYQLSAPVVTAGTATAAPTFTITATPIAGNGQDKDAQCASFTVDSTGRQSALNSSSTDSTATCW